MQVLGFRVLGLGCLGFGVFRVQGICVVPFCGFFPQLVKGFGFWVLGFRAFVLSLSVGSFPRYTDCRFLSNYSNQ